ncbi:20S-pre-rRNA D-site endonuclease nob1 [Paraconiothyrium brasiliense]|uniref:20S-pre-rRNA D-site endonuclease NOB1 n=1 Tax=Paraconiothyrium brasiliense TaxID=300254 RepID=A0ABR3QNQ7_9PLEO
MATQNSEKLIHSIIIDTGPLIHNTVSISTILSSAEVLYTTPAIIAEIRDPATRSRVETTLLPFLNIKTPSPASYDAVAEFAKKTGDYPVLSKQDLGILALAYEVYCEKHGGSFGLRSVPKGPVKLTAEEQKRADEEAAEKREQEAKKEAEYATIREKKAELKRKQNEVKEAAEAKGEVVAMPSQPTEGLPAEPVAISQGPSDEVSLVNHEKVLAQHDGEPAAPVETPEHDDAKMKKKKVNSKKARRARQYAEKQALLDVQDSKEQPNQPEFENSPADGQEDIASAQTLDASSTIHQREQEPQEPEVATHGSEQAPQATQAPEQASEKPEGIQKKMHPEKSRLVRRAAEREALVNESSPTPSVIQQPTPPTSEDDSDSNEWITPGNLSKHQHKDTSDTPLRAGEPQLSVATMTTDYAMQNVLLQMNMQLLSPAMQRIRQARSTILRCHACFLTTREMDKQFCPRCGQPTLQRVACSTNAKGEFQIHLSTKYQHNKRGDKYSIPKPVGGTSNGKLRGQGGGKGGWGRDLVLSEDQKEFQRQNAERKRMGVKDPMDQDYLPDILTGNRSKHDGRPKVGAGRDVNSRKRN